MGHVHVSEEALLSWAAQNGLAVINAQVHMAEPIVSAQIEN